MGSTILQQTFVVEYIVNHQMCDDCRRVEAKDTWNASVQVRQKTSQRKTLYFLEQILLKYNATKDCVGIKTNHGENLICLLSVRNKNDLSGILEKTVTLM